MAISRGGGGRRFTLRSRRASREKCQAQHKIILFTLLDKTAFVAALKQQVSRTKFPLVTQAAPAIGTSRATLFRVLRGDYSRPEMVTAYWRYVAEHLPPAALEQLHRLTTDQHTRLEGFLAAAERLAERLSSAATDAEKSKVEQEFLSLVANQALRESLAICSADPLCTLHVRVMNACAPFAEVMARCTAHLHDNLGIAA